MRIFRLNGLLIAAGDDLSRPAGQSSARWQVLAAAEKGPASVAQIARWLALTRQSVQRIADLLESEGLAEYVGNPAHKRAKLLRLTDRGVETLRTIQERQAPWADEVGSLVGESNLRGINQMLDRVFAAITQGREEGNPEDEA